MSSLREKLEARGLEADAESKRWPIGTHQNSYRAGEANAFQAAVELLDANRCASGVKTQLDLIRCAEDYALATIDDMTWPKPEGPALEHFQEAGGDMKDWDGFASWVFVTRMRYRSARANAL